VTSATAAAKTVSTGIGARNTSNITIGIRTAAVAMRFSKEVSILPKACHFESG
jgi:hypothetical protein